MQYNMKRPKPKIYTSNDISVVKWGKVGRKGGFEGKMWEMSRSVALPTISHIVPLHSPAMLILEVLSSSWRSR